MFEPSRLAQQCLEEAYARLIPTVHQRLNVVPLTVKAERPAPERNAQ